MGEKLGNSNKEIIENMTCRRHSCLFYSTIDDLFDLVIPYFKSGLKKNEFCMWILPEHIDVGEVKQTLGEIISDFEVYIEKNQIEILPYAAWDVKNKELNCQETLNFWINRFNSAFDNGYSGLRLI